MKIIKGSVTHNLCNSALDSSRVVSMPSLVLTVASRCRRSTHVLSSESFGASK
jgi:hypothetical protein